MLLLHGGREARSAVFPQQKGRSIMRYTLDTLRAINGSYATEHSIWPSDVEKVNDLSARLEAERQGDPVPTDGDIVVCATPGGEVVSDRGHLQKRADAPLFVCVHHTTPFVGPGTSSEAGGGPEIRVREEELEFAGKQLNRFCAWGHAGPCRNGAIDFQAEVSVWRVVDSRSRFT
jgi:hypothetical protein